MERWGETPIPVGFLSGLTGIRQGMASRWQRGRRGVHRHPILPGTLAGLDPIWEQGQFAATAPKCIRNQARAFGKSQGPSDGEFVRGSGELKGMCVCRSAQSNWEILNDVGGEHKLYRSPNVVGREHKLHRPQMLLVVSTNCTDPQMECWSLNCSLGGPPRRATMWTSLATGSIVARNGGTPPWTEHNVGSV